MKFKLLESIETDAAGNPLSPEQIRFFKNSAVRENGKLLPCYHGTDDSSFRKFDRGDIGFHFGPSDIAEARMEWKFDDQVYTKDEMRKMWRVIPAYLNIEHPLDAGWDFGDWSAQNVAQIFLEDEELDSDTDKEVEEELRRIISISTDSGEYHSESAKALRALMKKKGYDGIWYPNQFEGSGYCYIALYPDQIKLITNTNPTHSNNIDEEIL